MKHTHLFSWYSPAVGGLWWVPGLVLKHSCSSVSSGWTKVKRRCSPSTALTEVCYLSDTDCVSVGDKSAVYLRHCRSVLMRWPGTRPESSVDQLMLLKLAWSTTGLFLEKSTVTKTKAWWLVKVWGFTVQWANQLMSDRWCEFCLVVCWRSSSVSGLFMSAMFVAAGQSLEVNPSTHCSMVDEQMSVTVRVGVSVYNN